MNKELKEINWWRILQVFCLMAFMTQMFVLIQIVLIQHYPHRYVIDSIITNFIIFAFALICVSNLIPKDFHIKTQLRNSKQGSKG